ncbi:MAG: hypothetical protein QN423_12475, partial [Nitrososphaeraceae archaeon]|nr:hypothetical protein [Nitrososphaeraceae archaeon]
MKNETWYLIGDYGSLCYFGITSVGYVCCVLSKHPASKEINNYSTNNATKPLFPVFTHIHKQSSA